jgi:hypothetical protein
MKHIKLFEHFAENVVEGINYNGSKDADLEEIGGIFAKHNTSASDEELIKLVEEALKSSKPVSLTGKIKEDAPKVIKYLVDAFKRAGVDLDDRNVAITHSILGNEIEIPVAKQEGICFLTFLDYYEIAENGNGKSFIISGAFMIEENGITEYEVSDINNNAEIVKAASEFNKYLETAKSEN